MRQLYVRLLVLTVNIRATGSSKSKTGLAYIHVTILLTAELSWHHENITQQTDTGTVDMLLFSTAVTIRLY